MTCHVPEQNLLATAVPAEKDVETGGGSADQDTHIDKSTGHEKHPSSKQDDARIERLDGMLDDLRLALDGIGDNVVFAPIHILGQRIIGVIVMIFAISSNVVVLMMLHGALVNHRLLRTLLVKLRLLRVLLLEDEEWRAVSVIHDR